MSMAKLEWKPFGHFQIARGLHTLLCKLPFFDGGFREYARTQRASWDGLEKAWVFPSNKEQDVLASLRKMDAEREDKAKIQEEGNDAIKEQMMATPFQFQSSKLKIDFDAENLRFIARFPYNDDLSRQFRTVGGRWNPELKAHTIPLHGLSLIELITAKPRKEQALFVERNQPWISKEAISPLIDHLNALQPQIDKKIEFHELKLEADCLDCTYKITFPFGLDSRLGREVFRENLLQMNAFDIPHPTDLERQYPRINGSSIVFELSQRTLVEKVIKVCVDSLQNLGAYTKIVIQDPPSESARRWQRRVDPEPGEIIIQDNQAFLIGKAHKSKEKVSVKAHHITAEQAKERFEAMDPTAKRRCCDMSLIDFEALDSYVEALYLREISQKANAATPSAKPMRI